MSWIVKGYKSSSQLKSLAEDRITYDEVAQYIPDVQRCVKEAISAGSNELFIVKQGDRTYREEQKAAAARKREEN